MSRSGDLGPFLRDLDKLDKKVRNKAIRQGLRAGAKILAAEIRSRAPVGPTGDLKKGVKIRAGKRKKDTISIDVEVSTPEGNIHTGFVEFGTVDQPANPFIRTSARVKGPEVVDQVFEAIEQSIG